MSDGRLLEIRVHHYPIPFRIRRPDLLTRTRTHHLTRTRTHHLTRTPIHHLIRIRSHHHRTHTRTSRHRTHTRIPHHRTHSRIPHHQPRIGMHHHPIPPRIVAGMALVASKDAVQGPGIRHDQPAPVPLDMQIAAHDERTLAQDVVETLEHSRPDHALHEAGLVFECNEEHAVGRRRSLAQHGEAGHRHRWMGTN